MRPVRDRVELREFCLDSIVEPDHPVRAIWQFVHSCDLETLSAPIKVREGHSGRPAIDPAILFALWLWATVDKVATARHIDRLCKRDDTYRWLCGGVRVNYHAISDFCARRGPWLDAQLTRSIAALIEAGMVDLATVARDGMRVRAHAKRRASVAPPRSRRCWPERRGAWPSSPPSAPPRPEGGGRALAWGAGGA